MLKRITALFLIALFLLCSCTAVQEELSSEAEDVSSTLPNVRTDDMRRILVSKGCSYSVTGTPHKEYTDDGKQMTDGFTGDGSIGAGWRTDAGSVTVDLGEVKDNLYEFNIYLRGGNWDIVAPTKCVYYYSDDNENWHEFGTVSGNDAVITPYENGWTLYSFPYLISTEVKARYIRYDLSGDGMNYIWAYELSVWQYVKDEQNDIHEFSGTTNFSNLDYTNPGYMGDNDGPAYCVYSKKGYNKAEFIFELSQLDVNNLGSNGARVNAFVFLGIDVYNDQGNWMNCCDSGFYYTGVNGGWQLFTAIYDDGAGEYSWYSCGPTIDPTYDYKLVLDSSYQDGKAKLTIINMYDGAAVSEHEFDLYGAKASGQNTSYLTNIAFDWAGESTWVDSDGNATDDWKKVMRNCIGSGIRMKNVRIYGCALYKDGERLDWTSDLTDRRCITPDRSYTGFDEQITTVRSASNDTEYIVDLDLG